VNLWLIDAIYIPTSRQNAINRFRFNFGSRKEIWKRKIAIQNVRNISQKVHFFLSFLHSWFCYSSCDLLISWICCVILQSSFYTFLHCFSFNIPNSIFSFFQSFWFFVTDFDRFYLYEFFITNFLVESNLG
jgi:hypothetical protein